MRITTTRFKFTPGIYILVDSYSGEMFSKYAGQRQELEDFIAEIANFLSQNYMCGLDNLGITSIGPVQTDTNVNNISVREIPPTKPQIQVNFC